MRRKKPMVLQSVTVEDYAAEGRSLARVEGKVIFIENTVPGDVVDVRLFKNKKDYAEGYPLRFHEYSAMRTEPFCTHFGLCGGCRWQMLPYENQLMYKQREVEENLKRIGRIELPPVAPIVGSVTTRYYRNKLEYTFSNKQYLSEQDLKNPDKSMYENVAGFHAPGVFDKVVPVDECFLMEEPNNKLRLLARNFALQNGYSFYDSKLHTGFMRSMTLRICSTGEVMVNMVFGYEDDNLQKALLDHLLANCPGITTLLYTINTKWNDSIYDLTPVCYSGNGYVMEELSAGNEGPVFRFKIGPKSFFQTNTAQAEQLYRITRDFAGLTGSETVYDLYCGTGSIGIFVSPLAKKIIGVETIAEAVDDAKENARLNGIEHAHFFAGDVIKVCDDAFFDQHGRPDVVITDPPRAGMHEKLVQKLLQMEAPRIVYVSCNPATQARDLRLLNDKYQVTQLQPVDMFPHTHHIENVAQLELRKQ